MDTIKDIRDQFRFLKVNDIRRGNTIEIQNAQFLADEHSIFGEPNSRYIEAELEWYKSKSLNVYDLFHLYNGEVKIWKQVAAPRWTHQFQLWMVCVQWGERCTV